MHIHVACVHTKLLLFPTEEQQASLNDENDLIDSLPIPRTKTAVDAIKLMGDLATTLGYYSCTYSGGSVDAYLG